MSALFLVFWPVQILIEQKGMPFDQDICYHSPFLLPSFF